MNRSTVLPAIALSLTMFAASLSAWADELGDIKRLHAAGQTGPAMQRMERLIAANPADAPTRFFFGVMLVEGQRTSEAADVFAKLTMDHPDLAEAHNNLATLHAAAGDYDRARASLEQALRTRPDYAVAHENLGDVYAMLASQSYARAATLDPGNSALQPKIALVRELFSPKTASSAPRAGTPR